MVDYHGDQKIAMGEATVKPTRSFRHEDYNTRRVFLRSYPLQWDGSAEPDEKQGMDDGPAGTNKKRPVYGSDGEDEEDHRGDKCCGGARGWRRQMVVAAVEWGEEKMLLLRRAKKRLALYLLGCHHGHRPALSFRSGGSAMVAMLTSR